MATNPVGKGTKIIGLNMNTKMADELERRAVSMHLSVSKYVKLILIDLGQEREKAQAARGLTLPASRPNKTATQSLIVFSAFLV